MSAVKNHRTFGGQLLEPCNDTHLSEIGIDIDWSRTKLFKHGLFQQNVSDPGADIALSWSEI